MNNLASLFNFINLYLKNEKDNKKVILNIINYDNELEFRVWFNTYNDGFSSMKLSKDIISDEDIKNIFDSYRDEPKYIEEKYYYNKETKICNYYALLSNNRIIYLTNFNLKDVNKYRNIIFNNNDDSFISLVQNKKKRNVKTKKTKEKNKVKVKKTKGESEESGYANYIGILSILMIILSFIILGYILYTSLY